VRWMPRNLDGRRRGRAPVDDPRRQGPAGALAGAYFATNCALDMQSDGSFKQRQTEGEPHSAQLDLIKTAEGAPGGT